LKCGIGLQETICCFTRKRNCYTFSKKVHRACCTSSKHPKASEKSEQEKVVYTQYTQGDHPRMTASRASEFTKQVNSNVQPENARRLRLKRKPDRRPPLPTTTELELGQPLPRQDGESTRSGSTTTGSIQSAIDLTTSPSNQSLDPEHDSTLPESA
jgi:hypothetical protein